MIIPCAGFGTRVGSPLSKELLLNPETQSPLIEYSLKIAEENQWNTVLITRPEKKNLMDYVAAREAKKNYQSQWVLVQKTTEWPDSVLRSSAFWSEKNILVLPDTTWNPSGFERQLMTCLETSDVAYGVFETKDQKTWGTICCEQNELKLCEKPAKNLAHFQAWGLIAFRKNIGKVLFTAILESTLDQKVKSLHVKSEALPMNSFTDLTRP